MARIYISSTSEDLEAERKVAWNAVRESHHRPVGMETYTASERPPIEKCLDDVRGCDAYVAIVAWRYGSTPSGSEKSFTELEYEEAGKKGIPRLCFVLSTDAYWPRTRMDKPSDHIEAFRERLQNEKLVGEFSDGPSLTKAISAAIRANLEVAWTIPPLWLNMLNRWEQVTPLEDVVKAWKRREPLVLVVHGTENQSHEMFRQRLVADSLPRCFGSGSANIELEPIQLRWPGRFRNRQELERGLFRMLDTALSHRGGSASDVIAMLARHPAQPVFHTHLLTDDWEDYEEDIVHGYFEFWRNLSREVPAQKLLALLFFKYELPKGGYFRRRKRQALNRAIRSSLDRLASSAGGNGPAGVECPAGGLFVLPALEDVPRRVAEEWAREADRSEYVDSQQLVDIVRDIYDRWERTHATSEIPMEHLATSLKEEIAGLTPFRETP